MKVLMIGHSLHPKWFGGEPRIARLVQYALRKYGCNVKILALPPRMIKWRIRFSAISVDPTLKWYEHHLQKFKPDVVVLWYDAVLDSAIHLLKLAKALNYKLIYSVHYHHLWCPDGRFFCLYEKDLTCDRCMEHKLLRYISSSSMYTRQFLRKLNRLRELLQRYTEHYKFIVPSRFMSVLLQKILRVPKENISIIYNGIDIEQFKPVEDKADKPTVLFVGSLEKHKGFHHYLLLVKRIRERNPEIRALAVGKGVLAMHARKYGVEYLGMIPDEELVKLYSRAWIVIVPSLWPEPFPLVPLEAASCATVPIAYAVGGLVEGCEMVKGITIPRGDLQSLQQVTLDLIRNPSKVRALGETCRRAVQRLSLKNMVREYVNEMHIQ